MWMNPYTCRTEDQVWDNAVSLSSHRIALCCICDTWGLWACEKAIPGTSLSLGTSCLLTFWSSEGQLLAQNHIPSLAKTKPSFSADDETEARKLETKSQEMAVDSFKVQGCKLSSAWIPAQLALELHASAVTSINCLRVGIWEQWHRFVSNYHILNSRTFRCL